MTKREDYIKQLHDHDIFKEVVAKASSDAERRAIYAFSEEFLASLVDAATIVKAAYESNPDAFQKVLAELESQQLVTGSLGV